MTRYIDAEELQEEIKSLSVMLGGNNVFKTAKESVLRIIDEQPTADVVEVKHGRWFVKEFSYSKFITCSVCNSVIDSSYTNIDENEFDYCPYCGAKMDGRSDT